MTTDGPRFLRAADNADPIWRLWQDLPAQWREPIIGPGIGNWKKISETANGA